MQEKLTKELKMMFDSTKTVVTNNLISAVSSNQIKVDRSTLESLLPLVNGSIDQAFFQSHRNFLNTVESEYQKTDHQPEQKGSKKK